MASPLTYLATPLRQIATETRTYSGGKFRRDVVAGATVAAVAVPQSMAYALIAGVPVQYGIYTVVFQCLIGSLLNSQKLLSVGPINSQSLLVASIATRAIGGEGADYLAFVFALTLIKGLIQMGLASVGVGNLVRYVSRSVIVGFTAGAAVLIAAGQVDAFLGFKKAPLVIGETPYLLTFGIQETIMRTASVIGEANWRALVLGLVALAIVVLGKRISRYFPGPLIAILVAGGLVWLLNWMSPRRIPEISGGFDVLSVPTFDQDMLGTLMLGGFALALLGLMEAYAIGKAIALQTGDKIDANQELFSQGLTNAITSFLSCIPGSGSFSRSALNHQAGAATAFSGIYNAIFVAVVFLLLAPLAEFVPMSSISAILFVVAWGLIDWRYFKRSLAANPDDAIVCLATFGATLFLPLKYAVFIGIGLNIMLQLRVSAKLFVSRLVPTADGRFREADVGEPMGEVPILQLEGDLFFATADALERELERLRATDAKSVILRLRRVHHIDVTALHTLERFIVLMQTEGREVFLCGVNQRVRRGLEQIGLTNRLDENHVLAARDDLMEGLRIALRQAVGGTMAGES
ncbi:MAG: SulP family inorganic anion transporter [Planctomycetota bacterium]